MRGSSEELKRQAAAVHWQASKEMQEFCNGCANQGKCPQPCKFWDEYLRGLIKPPDEKKEK